MRRSGYWQCAVQSLPCCCPANSSQAIQNFTVLKTFASNQSGPFHMCIAERKGKKLPHCYVAAWDACSRLTIHEGCPVKMAPCQMCEWWCCRNHGAVSCHGRAETAPTERCICSSPHAFPARGHPCGRPYLLPGGCLVYLHVHQMLPCMPDDLTVCWQTQESVHAVSFSCRG